jgi:hypothetical protein
MVGEALFLCLIPQRSFLKSGRDHHAVNRCDFTLMPKALAAAMII